jgi:LmbE family N-acetylglucosaminyl deacetylase
MTARPLPALSPADRVMVLAPHPDDEALGAGGIIQHARAAGAGVRVVFATDGDNNPWPQRFAERRLRLADGWRQRLGATRRGEARRSLATLGMGEDNAVFLGFHDGELLARWRRRAAATLAAFARELAAWPPTVLVAPSPCDRHGDHRAVFAFAAEALVRAGLRPAVYSYLIHRPWLRRWARAAGVALPLSPEQQERKRQAILCHDTQMKLSRGRFTSFAKPVEMLVPEPLPAAAARA